MHDDHSGRFVHDQETSTVNTHPLYQWRVENGVSRLDIAKELGDITGGDPLLLVGLVADIEAGTRDPMAGDAAVIMWEAIYDIGYKDAYRLRDASKAWYARWTQEVGR